MEAIAVKFKYRLPEIWIKKIESMEEFANGATQVTIRLKNGQEVSGVLVSDATYVVAVRGFEDLPFALREIDEVFQSSADKSPNERGGWRYWDDWQV